MISVVPDFCPSLFVVDFLVTHPSLDLDLASLSFVDMSSNSFLQPSYFHRRRVGGL